MAAHTRIAISDNVPFAVRRLVVRIPRFSANGASRFEAATQLARAVCKVVKQSGPSFPNHSVQDRATPRVSGDGGWRRKANLV